ncbi:hypothetical protein BFP70_02125 [Thioclava sp. SK-1]|uniref:gluconate 2-dehydrogenase subunit 3 family protein n=1 Tax=Thioclava sp. SK-1 TaxID=1889770 RepID=UPI000824913B|nr:gluconate 2-dehydrogenase subunit 3 family protein [Thioclava sp. SK-1]OCX67266.1 hypothetical protein BFP70_02125 [Thioclava sp. SK-1]
MNRRELLQMIAAVTGTTMIAGSAARAYTQIEAGRNIFTPEDTAFLDELAEVILPQTETPGAKAAAVGSFMATYVSDCYTQAQQDGFRHGMTQIEAHAQGLYGEGFLQLTAAQRLAMIEDIAALARYDAGEGAAHWFTPMHQLVLFGFFTSELGATEVLRYEPVPGEYIGDLEYNGEPAWAT